jgi:hypothetical protein
VPQHNSAVRQEQQSVFLHSKQHQPLVDSSDQPLNRDLQLDLQPMFSFQQQNHQQEPLRQKQQSLNSDQSSSFEDILTNSLGMVIISQI